MQIPAFVWALTIFGIVALLVFDYRFHVRRAHVPSMAEAARWSAVYIGLAIAFGAGVAVAGGTRMGTEYFAGYITEKALSVDNLFVFLLIITTLKVPRPSQQKVLLFGITVSLIARTGFILIGAALISSFAWVFYFFGLILFVTAVRLLTPTREASSSDNFAVRFTKRLTVSDGTYDGDNLFATVDKRRRATPLLLAMIAIGATDVLFALDSIPAIFGLTQNLYLVITATAFSLLGLRQLYFLIDGLLDRLVYLSYGLAAILGFIGVKLVLHALHENNLAFVNHGRPVAVVQVDNSLSLGVILGILLVTIGVSLAVRPERATRGREPESTPAIECAPERQPSGSQSERSTSTNAGATRATRRTSCTGPHDAVPGSPPSPLGTSRPVGPRRALGGYTSGTHGNRIRPFATIATKDSLGADSNQPSAANAIKRPGKALRRRVQAFESPRGHR